METEGYWPISAYTDKDRLEYLQTKLIEAQQDINGMIAVVEGMLDGMESGT